ncbi:MAG: MerR family transcriptional regulator [Beijerinckiaceae bacterium]
MDKSEDAFRTISEAAEELDLPQHVLRFWETRFPQIRPLKRGGGRRYYRPDDVELLRAIRHLLYNDGYTIKGVQRMLKERGVRAVLAMRVESAAVRPPPPPRNAAPEPIHEESAPRTPVVEDQFSAEQATGVQAPIVVVATGESTGDQSRPLAEPVVLAGRSPAQRAPAWTGAQRRTIEAIAAELAECRRILGAANI